MSHAGQEAAPDHSHQGERHYPKTDWLPKTKESGMLMNHNKGVSWWVYGLCDQHESERENHREHVNPMGITEALETKHANKSTTQMPTK